MLSPTQRLLSEAFASQSRLSGAVMDLLEIVTVVWVCNRVIMQRISHGAVKYCDV